MKKTFSKLCTPMVFVLMLLMMQVSGTITAQNNTCSDAFPFCTGTAYDFPAGVNAGSAGPGPSYSCVTTQPNPAFYYLRIGTSGDIEITIYGNGGSAGGQDIDFVCWGPYTDYNTMCSSLTGGNSGSHHASGSGGGYPNGNVVDCSYDPSATEWCYIPGAVTGQYYMLMLTNYSNNTCDIEFSQTAGTATSDCSVLSGSPTNNGPLCEGSTLNLTSTYVPGGVYSWTGPNGFTSSLQNPTIPNVTSANAGTYTLVITVGTQSSPGATTTVTLTTLSGTDAGSPPGVISCATPTLTLTGSGGTTYSWSASGGGNITSGATSATPIVDAAGTYTVTVSTGGCTGTDNVVITSNTTVPIADAGTAPGEITCAVTSQTLTASGGGTYSWSGGVITSGGNTATPTVGAGGTYTVTVTDATSGCTASDNVVVTENLTVTADAGVSPGTITCSTTSLMLSASGGTAYSWSASGGGNITSGANTSTPIISAGGTYTVTVSDGGCSAVDNVVVAENLAVAADAGVSPGTITCNTTILNLTASGGTSYSWSASGGGNIISGATTATPSIDAGGTYTVTVTDASNGCSATDNVVVTENTTIPLADAGGAPGTISCTVISLTLTASGGGSYSWSASGGGNIISGATTATPTVNAGGTYTVTVTDGTNGCTATDNVIIAENTTLPSVNAGLDISICTGNSTLLNTTGVGSYLWSPSSTLDNPTISNPTATPAVTTTYTVVVTGTNGCSASDNIVVTINPIPVADAGLPVSLCGNNSATLTASGGANYVWSNGVFTAANIVNPTSTTIYTVTVSDAIGCSSTDDVMVTVNAYTPPIVYANGPMGFCFGSTDPVTLTATNGYTSYFWSTGETTQSIVVTTVGTYWVIAESANGCSDTLFVPVQSFPAAVAPVIIADGPIEFCEGDVISVNLSTEDPYYAYLWSSGSITSQIHVTHAGFYSVTVTDSNGCTAASQNQIHVEYIPKPVAYVNYNAFGTYVNFYDYSLNGDSYLWDFGDGSSDTSQNPSHMYALSGEYDVMLIVSNICGSDTAFVTIRIFSGTGFADFEFVHHLNFYPVPAHELFYISFDYSGLSVLEVSIYNALGQKMYVDIVGNLTGSYNKTIHVESFPPGIYFLHFNTDRGFISQKIMIE